MHPCIEVLCEQSFSEKVFTVENRKKKSSNFHTFSPATFFRECSVYNFLEHQHCCSMLSTILSYHTITAMYKLEPEGVHTMLSMNCPATCGHETLQCPRSKIWWWKWLRKKRKERISEQEERCKIVGTLYSKPIFLLFATLSECKFSLCIFEIADGWWLNYIKWKTVLSDEQKLLLMKISSPRAPQGVSWAASTLQGQQGK